MEKKRSLYLKLFWSAFQLSAFTFGGGYVIVSLMRRTFVKKMGWLKESEMLDFTAIAQSAPGAIATNTAFLIGYKVAGIGGALITVFATVLPPLLIIYVISFGYQAFGASPLVQNVFLGMRAGVVALIVDVLITMSKTVYKSKTIISVAVSLLAFLAVTVFSVNVMLVIPACGIIGFLLFTERKED